MQLTVELSREDNGSFRARCPELGLRICDGDRRQAVDRLTSMICEYLTLEHWQGRDETTAGPAFACALLLQEGGPKVVCSPRYLLVH